MEDYGKLINALVLASALSIIVINTAIAETPTLKNAYIQTNFVANSAKYKPSLSVENNFIDAWGIAIRPKGAGGHFWVTAKNISYEYVGDVKNSSNTKVQTLHQDALKTVKLPVGGESNLSTGVVFNDSKENFVITQSFKNSDPIVAPAKFLFASDGGIISGWTERKNQDGTVDWPSEAITVIDESKNGAQYFGLAINHNYTRLYAADFGVNPNVRVFDGQFKPLNISFENPFDTNKNGKVDAGEYAPFNVQALDTPAGEHHIFVTYAKTQTCPADEIKKGTCAKGEILAGKEDATKAGNGRLAEFTEDGKLVAIWPDAGKLNAPWGIVYAPANFGALSNALLVGNFGDGTIAAFNPTTRSFIDIMRTPAKKPIIIEKLWGLLFGNGESLGDANALYFAAGPNDEKDGVFGSLRVQ